MTDFSLGARRVSDLPFPNPSLDHQRMANALWLIENNPGGRALLPADAPTDDTPRFAAVAPSTSSGASADQILSLLEREDAPVPKADATPPQIGRTLLARDIDDMGPPVEAQPTMPKEPPRDDFLHYDGSKLRPWRGDGTLKAAWSAASGLPRFQREQDQSAKNEGPLPQGVWSVGQNNLQSLSLKDDAIGILGSLLPGKKRGTWPGGSIAWGGHRVWINPDAGTETYGRTGFSIHGGAVPGSAGCIDLTRNMEPFARMFREYGKDINLYVDYSRE